MENLDVHSPLFRYLCSQSPIDALKQRRRHLSPFSPLENLVERSPPSPVYITPVRALQTEEVLVMDGVLVTGGGRSSRSSSSDSSGKFQFAHGKEKLRPTRCPVKNKSEAKICKPHIGTGSCTPSPKSRFVREVIESSLTEAAATTTQAASWMTRINTTMETLPTTIICLDWSPQDDGIEVVLPSSSTVTPPSREDISSYISHVLCGPTTRRRLRVFAEICPE